MGSSPSSYILFGILVCDDDGNGPLGEVEDNEYDFDEVIGTMCGVSPPIQDWSEDTHTRDEYHAYWKARCKAISGISVSEVFGGCDGWTQRYAGVVLTSNTDYGGAPLDAIFAAFDEEKARQDIAQVLRALGIQDPPDPEYLLINYYG